MTFEEHNFEKLTPPTFCCHTADVYVGNVNYGSVMSCARTCEAAQTEWNNTRERIVEAVKKLTADIN